MIDAGDFVSLVDRLADGDRPKLLLAISFVVNWLEDEQVDEDWAFDAAESFVHGIVEGASAAASLS